jgi:hypothetical protein
MRIPHVAGEDICYKSDAEFLYFSFLLTSHKECKVILLQKIV